MPSQPSSPSAASAGKSSPAVCAASTSPQPSSPANDRSHRISPTKTQPCAPSNYYYLPTSSDGEREIELEEGAIENRDGEWRLPVAIEDEDITFDGQPLSALYEMEMEMRMAMWRWQGVEELKERGRKRHRDNGH